MSFTRIIDNAASSRRDRGKRIPERGSSMNAAAGSPMVRQAAFERVVEAMEKNASLLQFLAKKKQIFIGSHGAAVHALSESCTKKSGALDLYAATFPTIEVDYMLTAAINERQLARIAECPFEHVTFRISIEQLGSTVLEPTRWLPLIDMLTKHRFPFRTTLLFVLQDRLTYSIGARENLLQFLGYVSRLRPHLEFEHWTWNKNEVSRSLWAELSSRSIYPVGWDGPSLPGIVQRKIVSSRYGAHVRLLGRNAAGWFDAATKYQYQYKKAELQEFVSSLTPERPLHLSVVSDPPLQALLTAIELAQEIG